MPYVEKTAKALFALHEKGHLKDHDFKEAVTRFIRNATETDRWHLTTHYRSRAAATLILQHAPKTPAQYQSFCRKNLAHEHMVPDSFVYKQICSEPDVTLEYLQRTLRSYGLRATITRREDKDYLSKRKLKSNMPACFSDPGDAYFGDPLARYKISGLFDRLDLRTTESWWPLHVPPGG